MSDSTPFIPAEYIVPLNMNGLKGRLLRLPPKKRKREILVVYGHHSTLERWYALAQVMNDYGGVTMPDLPGLGGMDSFYKIGEKPDLDTMADYLAAVIKLRFKNRRITLAGLSYGFIVVTRMLQRYPEMAKRVDMIISLVGFAHYDDFRFSKTRMRMYRLSTGFFSHRLTAAFFHSIILRPIFLRTIYTKTHNAKHKFKDLTEAEKRDLTDFEILLWRINDVRTWAYTTRTMLTVNNCRAQIDAPVWHIGVDLDNYFDNRLVEQHMKVIFSDYIYETAPLKGHVPSVTAGKKENMALIPAGIKKVLGKNP